MARRMIARKQEGNIVNIAFGAGLERDEVFSRPTRSPRAGIIQATKAMALETGRQPHPRQLRLAPGYNRHRDEP